MSRPASCGFLGVALLSGALLLAWPSSWGGDLEDSLDAARIKIRAGKIPEAIELLAGLSDKEGPVKAEVHLVLAEAHERNGDQDAALAALASVREALAALDRVRDLTTTEEGWLKEAKAREERLLEFRTKEEEILRRFKTVSLQSAEALLKNGSTAQATCLLQDLERIFPEDAAVQGLAGRLPKDAP